MVMEGVREGRAWGSLDDSRPKGRTGPGHSELRRQREPSLSEDSRTSNSSRPSLFHCQPRLRTDSEQ